MKHGVSGGAVHANGFEVGSTGIEAANIRAPVIARPDPSDSGVALSSEDLDGHYDSAKGDHSSKDEEGEKLLSCGQHGRRCG